MTIAQSLKSATSKLSTSKISLPHLEAEILLSDVLKKPREFLLTHGGKQLTKNQISNLQFLISRRLKGEPVAYLVGHKEFYGLDFKVNKNVLIPRPESELMVGQALNRITRDLPAQASAPRITIVDIGTGSGCIIISIVKNLISRFLISNFQFLAIDISKKALAVARKNAKLHNVDKHIKFAQGDLLNPLIHNSLFIIPDSELILLANLPYGWKAWKNNCSLDTKGLEFEPPIALFTGDQGLKLYKRLLKQIGRLADARASLSVFLEFDPRQTVMLKKLIKQRLPQAKPQIKKDLAGLNRLAVI
jgi:release factor glutamine methyltransferase